VNEIAGTRTKHVNEWIEHIAAVRGPSEGTIQGEGNLNALKDCLSGGAAALACF